MKYFYAVGIYYNIKRIQITVDCFVDCDFGGRKQKKYTHASIHALVVTIQPSCQDPSYPKDTVLL